MIAAISWTDVGMMAVLLAGQALQNTQDQEHRMSDETTPQDSAAMYPASAGSVAGEPVAWAALRDDGDIAWIGYTPDGAADGACGRKVVPLYRSPTLTDSERTAIQWIIGDALSVDGVSVQATLRGLLDRTK